MKTKLLKSMRMLLVAVLLGVGSSAWATDVPTYTWDFTNTTTWTTAKVSTGSAVTLNPSGETLGVGEYGVTFNFQAEDTENNIVPGGFVGKRAYSTKASTTALFFRANGSSTENYISVTVPVGFKVTYTIVNGSSTRPIGYSMEGGVTTSGTTAATSYDYKNETESPVTIKMWATDGQQSGFISCNAITSIVLEDYSAVASHQWSATAVIKNTETAIDSWTGDTYHEGETYTVWAKKVITYNNQYYELDDDNFTGNAATFSTTMGSDDYEHTISYTLKTDIVYFTDGSDATATGCSVSERNDAEGGNTGYWINTNMVNTDISAGIYQVQLCNYSKNGNNARAIGVFLDGTSVGSFAATFKTEQSVYFTAPSDGNLKIYGTASSNKATNNVDYVIVRKVSDITFALADDEAKHLTFHNAGSGSANDDNWKMNVFNGGSKVAEVRADWYCDVAKSNSNFNTPYTYSADGGITSTTVVWAAYLADMQDADCDFTVSYTDGTLYIIGTMTKGNDIYYVNYSKSGLSGDVGIYLYGKNATLTSVSTASTDVNTTWVGASGVVTATLGSNGYGTFASAYPLDLTTANLPTGLTAYKAAVSGTTVTFSPLDQTVPANTGILLEGTASETYCIPVVASGTTVTDNAFLVNEGSMTFTADDNYYYFGLMKNTLTFGVFDPSSVAIPADKAYLKVLKTSIDESPSRALTIKFGDEETGIKSVQGSGVTVNGYYNLSGQRVSQPTKGLYIVNGKKVIIK